MKSNLTYLIIFIAVLTVSPVIAQVDSDYDASFDSIGDNVLFRKEMNGAFILHTNGWGLEYRVGRNKTIFNKRTLEFDLLEYKHSKEIKSINPFYTNTKSYIYGKLNTVYLVRAGFGEQRLLNRKPYTGGVELRLFYIGGLSVALAKPVYLNIMQWDSTETRLVIKTEKYNPENHFPDNIYGRASFLKGFNEIKPYPGLYAKLGLGIDFGNINQSTKLVEVGAVIDYFLKPVPIMANQKADQFFLTLYLSFGLGKRYD
ncbi:MAG TPA: hypothetical protein VK212_04805 [Lentimicrobium sp.]|nr:hypothetical protein [Lentimicrobium sp.]